MSDAITLRALRIAWSCPQRTSNCRVAAQLRSRAGSSNCVFVGLMTRSVVGTTMKMTAAPTSHPIPAPRKKAINPATLATRARLACMTVARL